MPAAVIFDCDGVLVDSERMEVAMVGRALRWFDCDADPAEVHDCHRGGTLRGILDDVCAAAGVEFTEDLVQRYRAEQLTHLREVPLVPGAAELVAAAPALRAIASGGPMAKMEVTLEVTGLWDAFAPHIYSCYDLGTHKPEPGVYLHAAARLGVPAAACVALEDSPTGVRAAANAGMQVIGLARDVEADALLAAGAHRTVSDLSEVPDHWG